jgi:hypothetical protein
VKKQPQATNVNQALLSVRSAVGKALKDLNNTAGKAMTKGDYTRASELADKGRQIQQFKLEVEALRRRWQVLRGGAAAKSKADTTPLWEFYQPVLQALSEAGGEGTRRDLEPFVERIMAGILKPGDHQSMARGRIRWQVMVRRSRKHLVAEGWLEDRHGPTWKITDAGRQASTGQTNPLNK